MSVSSIASMAGSLFGAGKKEAEAYAAWLLRRAEAAGLSARELARNLEKVVWQTFPLYRHFYLRSGRPPPYSHVGKWAVLLCREEVRALRDPEYLSSLLVEAGLATEQQARRLVQVYEEVRKRVSLRARVLFAAVAALELGLEHDDLSRALGISEGAVVRALRELRKRGVLP